MFGSKVFDIGSKIIKANGPRRDKFFVVKIVSYENVG